MLIEVGLDAELTDQDYSLVDYNFVLAGAGNSDMLFFEFITNKELEQSTTITFLDESGRVVAAKEAGTANELIDDSTEIAGERSFAYSIGLENLRSVSLVHEVVIGSQ